MVCCLFVPCNVAHHFTECRNNVAPTYKPRGADVWSLGIVLINMLYHHNPWTDTSLSQLTFSPICTSFAAYLTNPILFFTSRFAGMTKPLAELLSSRIFCILDNNQDDQQRIQAADLGSWVRANLVDVLQEDLSIKRSSSQTQAHRLSLTMRTSYRPTSRPPSIYSPGGRLSVHGTPVLPLRTLSRAPSIGLLPEMDDDEAETASRSTSTTRRRKRGLRKGRGASIQTDDQEGDGTLEVLTAAAQSLVREMSVASRASSVRSAKSTSFEPAAMYAVPSLLLSPSGGAPKKSPLSATVTAPEGKENKAVARKPSRWKLSFGRASASALAEDVDANKSALDLLAGSSTASLAQSRTMSTKASNVSTIIMGLNPPLAEAPAAAVTTPAPAASAAGSSIPTAPIPIPASSPAFGFGTGHGIGSGPPPRRGLVSPPRRGLGVVQLSSSPPYQAPHRRAMSPPRHGKDRDKSNWRTEHSPTPPGGSTSSFTRYPNGSTRSVSTMGSVVSTGTTNTMGSMGSMGTNATSVSGGTSWRASGSVKSTGGSSGYVGVPRNIKSECLFTMVGLVADEAVSYGWCTLGAVSITKRTQSSWVSRDISTWTA